MLHSVSNVLLMFFAGKSLKTEDVWHQTGLGPLVTTVTTRPAQQDHRVALVRASIPAAVRSGAMPCACQLETSFDCVLCSHSARQHHRTRRQSETT